MPSLFIRFSRFLSFYSWYQFNSPVSLIVQLHYLLSFLLVHIFLLIHTVFTLLNPFTAKLSVLCLWFRFPFTTAATNFLSTLLAKFLYGFCCCFLQYILLLNTNIILIVITFFKTEYEELDKHARKYIHKKMKVLKKKLYTGVYFFSIIFDVPVKRFSNELLV